MLLRTLRSALLRGRAGQRGDGDRALRVGWQTVGLLAVSQTAGYGVLYYSFSVFLSPMAASLRAGTTAVTGALTVSLLAAAAAAVPVGRYLDRRSGRGLMTWGSVAATLLVAAWSQARDLAELYAVWAALGIASAAVLYEAAFAVVVRCFDAARRGAALLAVTVVAGFASSIFLPLAGWLEGSFGWRTAVLVLAGLHGALTIPLHALLRDPRAVHSTTAHFTDPASYRSALLRKALRDPVYWLLAAGFVAQAVAVAAMSVLLVTMLRALGHGPAFAAAVAGLLGVLSVTGRLTATAASGRWSTGAITAMVFVVQGAGALLLGVFGRGAAGAVLCVLAFGLGFGVSTIARPALLSDRYGTTAYATLSATLAVPLTLVKALAPLGAAALWYAAGLRAVLVGVAACCLLGAAGLAAAQGRSKRARAGVDPPSRTLTVDGER